ncbi:MAG: hypothetical protein KAT65_01110, partial [Methanophagales archaeon]|nr:hypothetical protein [Methanophagales archaeon]
KFPEGEFWLSAEGTKPDMLGYTHPPQRDEKRSGRSVVSKSPDTCDYHIKCSYFFISLIL